LSRGDEIQEAKKIITTFYSRVCETNEARNSRYARHGGWIGESFPNGPI